MSAAASIAQIDLEPYRAGGRQARADVVERVDVACQDIGFFIVTGHGLPTSLIDDTMNMADGFFRLPLEEKLQIRQPATDISRGYTPFAAEQLSAGLGEVAPPDLKELIDIGPVDVPGGG